MHTNTITIPASTEDARAELEGLGALITAKEWSRAAIVFAYTHEGDLGGRPDKNPAELRGFDLSFSAFARLGIVGLKSENTVARYHRAWAGAVEQGKAKVAKPGKAVTLPKLEWPPDSKVSELGPERRSAVEAIAEEHGVGANKLADVINNPAAVRAAILGDPSLREAARGALSEARDADENSEESKDFYERLGDGRARFEEGIGSEWSGDAERDACRAIGRAMNNVGLAIKLIRGSTLMTDEEREYLIDDFRKLRQLVDLGVVALNQDDGPTDWDAAAAAFIND